MITRRLTVWIGVLPALAASLFFAGCGGTEEPLRVGMNLWPAFGLIQLAEAKGFFKQEGVEARTFVTGSLPETRRAYETGKVDGMAASVVDALVARDDSHRDPRVVRVVDFSDGADVILAPKRVRSVADLKDKTVGVEFASLGMFLLSRALGTAGLSLEDVDLVSKAPDVMVEDLINGRLDAVVAYPPASLPVLDDGRFRAIFSSADVPGEVVDVIVLDESVLRERPRQAAAFLRALDRAHRFLEEDPLEACRIMGLEFSMGAEEFHEVLSEGIKLVPPAEQARYLGRDGKLRGIVLGVGRALHQARTISSPPEHLELMPNP